MLTSNMTSSKQLFDMLCKDAEWGHLNLTGVYEPDVQNYFCSLDMDKLAMDLFGIMDVMSFVAEVSLGKTF